MIIKRTEKLYKRRTNIKLAGRVLASDNYERVKKTTFWFFFIPVYTYDEIITTTL
jgi:hypothetical protein